MTSKFVRFLTTNFSFNKKYYILKYGLQDIDKLINDLRKDLKTNE